MATPEKTVPQDLIGKVFGRLTVICFSHRKWNQQYWKCMCQCGNTKSICRANMIKGRSLSCGCLNKELASARAYKHGYGNTNKCPNSTYIIWAGMHSRCSNPNRRGWKNYGGRGITVCPEWDDFAVFLKDMGERPQGLTLDRINNDGNYSPSNCRWATVKVQNNNKRKTICCKNGHLREGNTGTNPTKGTPFCLVCSRAWKRAYNARISQKKRAQKLEMLEAAS